MFKLKTNCLDLNPTSHTISTMATSFQQSVEYLKEIYKKFFFPTILK
jgi:hypothetical protein